MAATKRSKFQIDRDRQMITDLYCQGMIQADIAERINTDPARHYTLTQQMISYDLKQIQNAWLKSSLRDFDEARARELAKVDRLEREYWRAWERSCEDAETIRQEGSRKPDREGMPPVEKIVKTAKGQAGDPRFLQGVQWCIDRRIKILGIEAASKIEIRDWRKEAEAAGLDLAELEAMREQLTKQMYEKMMEQEEGGSDATSAG